MCFCQLRGRDKWGCGTPHCDFLSEEYAAKQFRRVSLVFAWYDLWVGAFWDRKSRKLYILPLPCIGIVVQF